MIQNVTIELIDPALQRPLQAWSFENPDQITIGRKVDNNVVLADPYVSRNHARVEFVSGKWQVYSISEQKVYFGGKPYTVLELQSGVTFQLGSRGCVMRFKCVEESNQNLSTLMFDSDATPIFQLDTEKLVNEVTKIASGDYFRKLQDMARELRKGRENEDTHRHGTS